MLGNLVASMMLNRGTGGGRFGVTHSVGQGAPPPQSAPGGQWGSMLAMMQAQQAQQQQMQQASGGMGMAALLQQLMKNRQKQSGMGYQMQPAMMEQPQTMPQNPYQGFTPQPYRMGML